MKRWIISVCMAALVVNAQEIRAIKFDGLLHLSSEMAEEIIHLHAGMPIDIEKVDEAIRKLYAQGYFKDIWVTEEQGVLTFHFVEKPLISHIEISGYDEKKQEEILQEIGLKKGEIFDQRKITHATEAIRQQIEMKGFFDTVVESEVVPLKNGSIKVVFKINKGEHVTIRTLHLCGVEQLDKGMVEKVMANRERDFMGWLWGLNDGKLHLDQLPYEAPRIKDLYMRHGYLDAAVEPPLVRVDFDTYDAVLDLKVKEGKPYRVQSVAIVMSQKVVDEASLKERLKVRVGKTFSIEELRKDIKRIRTKIADRGYAFVRVLPDFKKDSNSHTVAVQYRIIPGERVRIRDVVISGNTRTIDRVVRREIYLAPGDWFSLSDLKDSKAALMRTGYFEDVRIQKRRIDAGQMDLIVHVKETQTGNIMVGGGYGSYDGFIFNASISDRNLFGNGLSVALSTDLSRHRSNFNFNITNPRIWDSDYSAGFNIYHDEYENYDYTEKRFGGSVTAGKQIARYWHLSATYQNYTSRISDYPEALPDYAFYADNDFTTSAVTLAMRFNNSDDYYLPREGMVATLSSQYAGLGGDAKYNKNFLTFATFYGLEDLIDYDLILRYKARGGFFGTKETLPVSAKFYLGGVRSVRGYESGSIGGYKGIYRTGGCYTFSNSVEASIPLVEAAKMRLAFFFDYGMIGDDRVTEYRRAGTGAAIEWFSPMGPIQLIFAKPLMKQSGDRTSDFEFTMGQRF